MSQPRVPPTPQGNPTTIRSLTEFDAKYLPTVAEAEHDRLWCAAILEEGTDAIERITTRFLALRAARGGSPPPADPERGSFEHGVTCWVCPDCAFTFDAGHTDPGTNTYSCPACFEVRAARGGSLPEKCPKCGPKGDPLSRCTVCGEEWYTVAQSRAHSAAIRDGRLARDHLNHYREGVSRDELVRVCLEGIAELDVAMQDFEDPDYNPRTDDEHYMERVVRSVLGVADQLGRGGSPAGGPLPNEFLAGGRLPCPDCGARNKCEHDKRRAAASGAARPPEPTEVATEIAILKVLLLMEQVAPPESAFARCAKSPIAQELSKHVVLRGSARPGAADPLREALDDLSSDGCVSRAIERYESRAPGMPHPSADGIKGILEPLWAALSVRAALSSGAKDKEET